ncbi:MAG TPA: hypothetical protein PKA63_13410 [Oligoflexia bacterium]|nr:hypothetical protein [Oligoflexia bacterium]HMP49659.1 hypothetical protein [Oligoflexia bacterium]
MSVLIVITIALVLLPVSAFGIYYFLGLASAKNKDSNDDGIKNAPVGLRGVGGGGVGNRTGNSTSVRDESIKRLLEANNANSLTAFKPKVRHKTQEFDQVSHGAVVEVLETLHTMISDCKERLKHFDSVSPDMLYSSSRELAANLVFARSLVVELEKRAELVARELKGTVTNYRKAYEIGTSRLILASDSVNTLIMQQDPEPIRWTLLGEKVKDILKVLDFAIREIHKKKAVAGYR